VAAAELTADGREPAELLGGEVTPRHAHLDGGETGLALRVHARVEEPREVRIPGTRLGEPLGQRQINLPVLIDLGVS
jgi:hypothetical protein